MMKKVVSTFLLSALLAYAFLKKELDRDPRTNLSYLAWKAGVKSFNAGKHRFVFVRDNELIQKLYGTSLEEFILKHKITLYDGQNFPASSYRGQAQNAQLAENPELSFLWFDENADDSGWVFIVENGLIKKILLLKG